MPTLNLSAISTPSMGVSGDTTTSPSPLPSPLPVSGNTSHRHGAGKAGAEDGEEEGDKSPGPPPDPAKKLKLRSEVIDEILSTERDYNKDLFIINSVFLIPLKATGVFSDQEISNMFSNIEVITMISDTFLKELEDIVEAAVGKGEVSGTVEIAPVFLKLSAYFKAYTQYCSDQSKALQTYEQWKAKPQFQACLQICNSDTRCRGLNLFSFLIKPVQRICKYPLLLRELMKHTDKEHPDYAGLQEGVKKVDEVMNYINEGKRFSEALMRVVNIQNQLVGCPNLLKPSRRFVREGALKILHKNKLSEVHIFLFTDLMMATRPLKRKNDKEEQRYEMQVELPLQECRLINVAGTDVVTHPFEMVHNSRSVTFDCPNDDIKTSWIKEINKNIKEFQKKQVLLLKRRSGMTVSSPNSARDCTRPISTTSNTTRHSTNSHSTLAQVTSTPTSPRRVLPSRVSVDIDAIKRKRSMSNPDVLRPELHPTFQTTAM